MQCALYLGLSGVSYAAHGSVVFRHYISSEDVAGIRAHEFTEFFQLT
jgi:hypothetical protein